MKTQPARPGHQDTLTATARQACLEAIQALTARIAELESQRSTAIATAVTNGITWAEIGRALGVTAQAAHQHYRWIRHSPITGETWHEPPLPRT